MTAIEKLADWSWLFTPAPKSYRPRHYATTESSNARRRVDWMRAWLVLGTQMEQGDADLAGDAAFALVQTAPDLNALVAA